MAKTKYRKYFVYDGKMPIPKGAPPPPPAQTGGRNEAIVLYVYDTPIKGAFYLNCTLIGKTSDQGSPGIVHAQDDYDEYVDFLGNNPGDLHDLCGEVESG